MHCTATSPSSARLRLLLVLNDSIPLLLRLTLPHTALLQSAVKTRRFAFSVSCLINLADLAFNPKLVIDKRQRKAIIQKWFCDKETIEWVGHFDFSEQVMLEERIIRLLYILVSLSTPATRVSLYNSADNNTVLSTLLLATHTDWSLTFVSLFFLPFLFFVPYSLSSRPLLLFL